MNKFLPLGFRFSKRRVLSFFLVVIFPINLWAILLWFKEIDQIIKRSDLWDAIGVGGYVLSYALIESVFVFLLLILIALLFPRSFDEDYAFPLFSSFYLILSLWVAFEQFRFLEFLPEEYPFISFIRNVDSSSILQLFLIVIVFILSLGFPIILICRNKGIREATIIFLDRLGTLSTFYLFINFIGLMIVIIRLLPS